VTGFSWIINGSKMNEMVPKYMGVTLSYAWDVIMVPKYILIVVKKKPIVANLSIIFWHMQLSKSCAAKNFSDY
jgi:hypothetical protein